MAYITEHVRLRADDERIAPVTIFDGQGRVVRVVVADDFRSTHPLDAAVRLLTVPRTLRRRAVPCNS